MTITTGKIDAEKMEALVQGLLRGEGEYRQIRLCTDTDHDRANKPLNVGMLAVLAGNADGRDLTTLLRVYPGETQISTYFARFIDLMQLLQRGSSGVSKDVCVQQASNLVDLAFSGRNGGSERIMGGALFETGSSRTNVFLSSQLVDGIHGVYAGRSQEAGGEATVVTEEAAILVGVNAVAHLLVPEE